MRCGHLTGTTTKTVLRCPQFSFSGELGDTVEYLFNAIGFKTRGKDVTKITSAGIKKAYKETLGYPTNAILDTMRDVVGRQIPHDSLCIIKHYSFSVHGSNIKRKLKLKGGLLDTVD